MADVSLPLAHAPLDQAHDDWFQSWVMKYHKALANLGWGLLLTSCRLNLSPTRADAD